MKKFLALLTSTVLLSGIFSMSAAAVPAERAAAEYTAVMSSASKKTSVKVKSLKLDKSKVTLTAGDTYTIKAAVTPSNASNKKLSYSSSDKSVAKVSSKGTVTAVKAGKAVISVKTTDGSKKTAKLNVTVKAAAKSDTAVSSGKFNTKISAKELVSDMQIGINLGNTLDAFNGNEVSDKGLSTETCWGNPKATHEMIDAIKAQGFNTIRIPVTWHDHLDKSYNINSDWMKRVKEVVDYAADNDMYIILNTHHDNVIYAVAESSKSDKKYKEAEKNLLKIWSQIAEVFKDYDEHLIFESMNEPHDDASPKAWTGGTAAEQAAVNKFNAAFTELVRKSGGNNKYRFLMLPSYGASPSDNALNAVKLPDDDRIILSVHAYTPYYFAMDGNGSSKFTDSDRKELDNMFKLLNDKFVKKGVPVVIGEMGATNKNNLSDRLEWVKYYVKNARKYNITCVWWDNGGFNVGEENFGIFNRRNCSFTYKDIADALVENSK